jgi:hypothetical protein
VRTFPNLLVAIAVAGSLAACNAGKPPESSSVALPLPANSATADPAASGASTASSPAESSGPSIPIPAATDDIWKAIDRQSADLDKIVQNGTMKDVHAKAFAIRDLTGALPAHASRLSADAQTQLQQDVELVATLAEHLDAAATAGDKAAVQLNYKKLNTALGGITRFP